MEISPQKESVDDEKIRKALSHFKDAEMHAKIESSRLLITVVRSIASKVVHFNVSKEGLLLVGQISQESQVRSHIPASLFEEYSFTPSGGGTSISVGVESRILLDCLTLSLGGPLSSSWKPQGSRRDSMDPYNQENGERRIPNLSVLGAENDTSEAQDNTTTYLILTKYLQNLVVMYVYLQIKFFSRCGD